MRGKQARGRTRELRVLDHYRDHGYVAFRCAWGVADVVALKAGLRPLLVQVKSTVEPYQHFRRPERADLIAAAVQADADALLAWWPAGGALKLIPSTEWPRSDVAVVA